MGLSSSMWTSVSGLLAHGEKMNVISNNLANVSTLGYKSQRMDFEDFLYQDSSSGSGPTQVGFGVGINTVVTDFSQGSFESTNTATDLAISGTGFFKVVNPDTGSDYYTRAGNFQFNNQGYLRLPSGEILQGWPVDNTDTPLPATGVNPLASEPTGIQTVGSPTDIVLDTWTIAPKATTKVEFSVNLMADDPSRDKSVSTEDNPLFAMAASWDGKNAIENDTTPLSDEAYLTPAPITIYDEAGNEHGLTCYFDQVPEKKIDPVTGDEVPVIDGLPTGYTVYEYLLTMDPNEDARTFGGTYNSDTGVLEGAVSFQDTEAAGILMKGTMIFDSSGNLVSQTAYSYMPNVALAPGQTVGSTDAAGTPATDPTPLLEAADLAASNAADALALAAAVPPVDPAVTPPTDPAYVAAISAYKDSGDWQVAYDNAYTVDLTSTIGHPDSALSWQPTPVSDSGYPVFTANFAGHPMGNAISQSKTETDTTKSKEADDILIEFDLGLQSENPVNPWAMGGIVGNTPSSTTSIADLMTPNAGGIATTIDYSNLATLVPSDRATGSSVSRGDEASIDFSSQDGYGSGSLINARIDANGVLYGIYNNDVEKPLYQIAMYDFVNPQGLYREGGNLYSETAESGSIQLAEAGTAGMGSIQAYNIEQSNVDMSVEFVQMIVTQRGFQGNSKGITTVDTMLEQVINMKR